MAVAQATDWTFGGTWPYEPHWLTTSDGARIHFVDEGPPDGQPVVMLHGNPTWSYLYRRFIRGLVDAGFRAVAYDELGFGRSDKPWRQREYTLERHIRHFGELVVTLGLDELTLVVHDWGGPIGLGWAVDNAAKVRRIVLFNTFAGYVPPGAPMHPAYRLVRAPVVGSFLIRGLNFPTERALFRLSNLDEHAKAAYRKPHPDWRMRAGVAKAPRMIPWDTANPTQAIGRRTWEILGRLADKPTLFCWGMKDPLIRPWVLEWMRERLPGAEVRELRHARHFVQEDAPEEIVETLLDFLERT